MMRESMMKSAGGLSTRRDLALTEVWGLKVVKGYEPDVIAVAHDEGEVRQIAPVKLKVSFKVS